MIYFMLDGLILLIFIPKYVSRVVFKGGILGGAHQFWGNSYLNSTTVLFDALNIADQIQLHDSVTRRRNSCDQIYKFYNTFYWV